MDLFGKLSKALRLVDQRDGSKEIVQLWINQVKNEREIQVLLANPAFQNVIDDLKKTFRARLKVLIAQDPELQGIKRVFDRTLGLKNTPKVIEEQVDQLIEQAETT